MATSSDRSQTDSVRVVETLRDTVVRLAADSSLLRALVECDSLGQARLRELEEYRVGDRLSPPSVTIRDNVLTATARVDSMAIYLTLKDKLKEVIKIEREVVTQMVEVNRLTWWQTLWVRVGQIAIAVAAAVAAWKLIKRRQ